MAARRRSRHPKPPASLAAQVERMRRFNRFYTERIGVIEDRKLYAPFSLAETRVLYELAHRERVTASDLTRDLGLDPGYLSRMLRRFQKKGLVTRRPAPEDARQNLLSLTKAGAKVFAPLEKASCRVLQPLLERLTPADRARVVAAMDEIEALLGGDAADRRSGAF